MRVCIISEGCYPIIHGGFSEWAHLLIRTLKDIEFEFEVLCISAKENEAPIYEKLPNVRTVTIKPLGSGKRLNRATYMPESVSARMVDLIEPAFSGKALDFKRILEIAELYAANRGWLASHNFWDFLSDNYQRNYPEGPFVEYFWTMYGLCVLLQDFIALCGDIPKADVSHCLSTGFAGVAGAMVKALHGRPMLVTEQGLYLIERREELARQDVSEWYRGQVSKFSESLVQTSYKYADWIVPPCRSHVTVEMRLGADPDKIVLVRNGIECDKFVPGYKNGSRPTMGCFARVVPIKGITTLIRAAKMVLDKCEANFVVVGDIQDRQYFEQCQELARQFGLNGHFRFIGHANPLEWYHKVDVFTLSSVSEGVPYALLEAMSCGLPSVCTAVGGVPEIIAEGVGDLVPPNQPENLAERLVQLWITLRLPMIFTPASNAGSDIDLVTTV